jgi:nucleotide-binding universal stress UspA family protein
MKVLVAIDGSPGSLEAVRQAGRLLAAARDEITFYYSAPGSELSHSAAGSIAAGSESAASKTCSGRQALAERVFEQALSQLSGDWTTKVRTEIGRADPREGVLQAAHDAQADLIVVGGRHYGSLERLLLSSVSRAVAHAARLPVLIVRTPERPDKTGEFRVLAAFESEQSGKRMARVLDRFTWPAESSAMGLHVMQTIFGGKVPDWLEAQARGPDADALVKRWVKEHDDQLAEAARLVQTVCREFPKPLRLEETRSCEGVPAEEILKAAEAQRSDLIVVGAKGSTPLGRLLLGSTAEFVLNHAHCSVLLLHNPPSSAAATSQ